MREIMKRAHELARKMEGNYQARMSLALRMAWEESRKMTKKVIRIEHQPSGGKEWVAEIVGRDPKYTYKREFLKSVSRDWSSSGKTGTTSFELETGKIYEINEPWKKRRFVEAQNGEVKTLTVEDVLARIS